jgi:hypothetical protein
LLLNAGAIHRIGPGRLHVALARRWAALGHAVLRLDLSGLGDSVPAAGDPENVVHPAGAAQDLAQALAFLQRQPGVTEVHALGLCSGGYHAFKAAVAGVALDGVLLINPLLFFLKPDQPLDVAAHEVTFADYWRRAVSREAWRKLAAGDTQVARIAKVMTRRFANMVRDRARSLLRRVGAGVADDLARELKVVADRKIALRFLFTAGQAGIGLLHDQGGFMVDKLRRRDELAIDVIDGPDHNFTPLWSHALLTDKLAAYFEGPLDPRHRPPSSRSDSAASLPTARLDVRDQGKAIG